MKRKIIIGLLTIAMIMCAFTFAACSKNNADNSSTSGSLADSQSVTSSDVVDSSSNSSNSSSSSNSSNNNNEQIALAFISQFSGTFPLPLNKNSAVVPTGFEMEYYYFSEYYVYTFEENSDFSIPQGYEFFDVLSLPIEELSYNNLKYKQYSYYSQDNDIFYEFTDFDEGYRITVVEGQDYVIFYVSYGNYEIVEIVDYADSSDIRVIVKNGNVTKAYVMKDMMQLNAEFIIDDAFLNEYTANGVAFLMPSVCDLKPQYLKVGISHQTDPGWSESFIETGVNFDVSRYLNADDDETVYCEIFKKEEVQLFYLDVLTDEIISDCIALLGKDEDSKSITEGFDGIFASAAYSVHISYQYDNNYYLMWNIDIENDGQSDISIHYTYSNSSNGGIRSITYGNSLTYDNYALIYNIADQTYYAYSWEEVEFTGELSDEQFNLFKIKDEMFRIYVRGNS